MLLKSKINYFENNYAIYKKIYNTNYIGYNIIGYNYQVNNIVNFIFSLTFILLALLVSIISNINISYAIHYTTLYAD